MKFHFNITSKLALILVSFGAVLISGLGTLAYTNGRAGLQAAATSELLSTAFEKQSALERWFAEARIDITAKSMSPVVVEQAAALLAAAPGSPEALAAHDRLIAELQPVVGPETVFIDLLFIHPDTGEVLASTNPGEEGKFKESQSYFINGRIKPYVSEVFYSTSLGRPAIAAAAPVLTEDGRLLGVLTGRLDMNILNSLISQRTGLRYSDDSYLVNAAGLLVTQPRFISDPVVLQRTIQIEAVTRCLGENSGVALYNNYNGTAVIGVYRWLPGYRVCLITEFDQDEAFAPSQSFGRTVALTGGLALVFTIALAIMLARNFTHPIRDLQNGVKRLSQGDLEYRVAVKSSDEVGRLADTFNEMAVSLQRRVTELSALNTLAGIVVESVDAQQVCSRSLEDVLSLVDINAGAVMELDLASGDMVMIAHRGLTDEFVQAASRMKKGDGLTWQAAESGQPAVMSDMSNYPGALKGYIEKERILSAAVIPLIGPMGVVGTMNLASSRERTFDAAGLELLTAVGRQIAIGLEKAHIYANLQDELTQRKQAERVQEALYTISQAAVIAENLPDLYLSIHRALGNLMPAENFYIALYDSNTDLISFPYFVDQHDEPSPPKKTGRGLTEYVLRTGRPLLADQKVFAQLLQQGEVELVGADSVDWLGMPLKVGAKVFGVMAVQSYTESVRLGMAEKEMLEFVSAQVTSAIERKRAEIDIRKKSEQLLLLSTELEIIIDSIPGLVFYKDANNRFIRVNKYMCDAYKMSKKQLEGASIFDLHSSEQAQAYYEDDLQVMRSRQPKLNIDEPWNTETGTRWVNTSKIPYISETGEIVGVIGISIDVTERKQAEQALQAYAAKLEKSNRDLQEFAYVASHDLQEPLRKVQAFSDRLASKFGDTLDETGRDYLKRMRDASARMQILINDLLDFSRVSTRAQPFTEVDLNTVAGEVLSDLENLIERTHARVEIGDLPKVQADATQMHQLLQNLIGNALKFHGEKRSPLIKVSAKIEKDTCVISVEDNGIGFDIQYLDRIFKPFQRLHSREEYEGSGMGLAICRRIVERHGGSITATSTPGKGTTFLVTLPIHPSKGDK